MYRNAFYEVNINAGGMHFRTMQEFEDFCKQLCLEQREIIINLKTKQELNLPLTQWIDKIKNAPMPDIFNI